MNPPNNDIKIEGQDMRSMGAPSRPPFGMGPPGMGPPGMMPPPGRPPFTFPPGMAPPMFPGSGLGPGPGMAFPYITSPVITIPKPELKKAPKKELNMEPNYTLYISNLNEEIRILDLKMSLERKFKKYGNVLDIVAQKNSRMRGTAFVIYDSIESAKTALEKENYQPLFHKEMLIQFSHNRSDKIADREGRLDENRRLRREKMVRRLEERRLTQPIKPQVVKTVTHANGTVAPAPVKSTSEHMIINKILFLTNLPEGVEESTLIELFKQYPGFKEVRLVPARSDIAFVEYESEMQAAMAKNTLNNYPILKDHPIKISFAKR